MLKSSAHRRGLLRRHDPKTCSHQSCITPAGAVLMLSAKATVWHPGTDAQSPLTAQKADTDVEFQNEGFEKPCTHTARDLVWLFTLT